MRRSGRRTNGVGLADVAARAGVSLATASRVLNNSPKVSDKTRTRVLGAVETLGYKVDVRARSLATGRSQIIGLLVADLSAEDDVALIRALLDEALQVDLRVHVAETRGESSRRLAAASRWQDDGVDAIILLSERQPLEDEDVLAVRLAEFIRNGGRVVQVGAQERAIPGSMLVLEEYDTAASLGESLARAGHSRFAVVATDKHHLAEDRATGFVSGVERIHGNGASFVFKVLGPQDAQQLEMDTDADCLFAVDAPAARTLATQLHALGLPLPEDVLLATFGYTGQEIPVESTVTAMMPAGVAAVRALSLAAVDGERALRVVGRCVVEDATCSGGSGGPGQIQVETTGTEMPSS